MPLQTSSHADHRSPLKLSPGQLRCWWSSASWTICRPFPVFYRSFWKKPVYFDSDSGNSGHTFEAMQSTITLNSLGQSATPNHTQLGGTPHPLPATQPEITQTPKSSYLKNHALSPPSFDILFHYPQHMVPLIYLLTVQGLHNTRKMEL